jgi:type IV pilus assembly protein PilE
MNKKGFSLMEIMIVVVIVGILAAVAIPAYTGYVTRTRRADAVTALETVALNEEKVFAETNNYVDLATLMGAPWNLPNPSTRYYLIAATPQNGGAAFIATATPQNEQAGDGVVFAIDSNGNRGRPNGGGTAAVTDTNLWNSLRK